MITARTTNRIAALATVWMLINCSGSTGHDGGAANLLAINVTEGEELTDVRDVASARAAAQRLGYLGDDKCAGGLKGGEEVMFAVGRRVEMEAGQASGVLVRVGDQVFFEQRQLFALDSLANAPGINSRDYREVFAGGKQSSWEFTSYLRLLCQVAFDLDKVMREPLYNKVQASLVSLRGGTAGLDYDHDNVMQLIFQGERAPHRSKVTFKLFLKKGFGPVGLEYAETGAYAPESNGTDLQGSFTLYINDQGGTGKASQATQSAWLVEKCQRYGGKMFGPRCYIDAKKPAANAEECRKVGGDWLEDAGVSSCKWKVSFG